MDSRPSPPPEAVLLRVARKAVGLSLTEAALAAGLSKAWLSAVESGSQTRDGVTTAVTGSDAHIARLAAILKVTPQELDAAGRSDAADVLREIMRRQGLPDAAADEMPAVVRANWHDPQVRQLWRLEHISPGARLGLVRIYVSERDAAHGDNGSDGRATGTTGRS